MAPLRRAVCRGTLPLTIVTAGFGHLDSNGRFQPQFQLSLPILAPGLGSARSLTPPPSFSLGKRTVLEFQPQLCQETVTELLAWQGEHLLGEKHCVSDSTTNAYDLT